jgi:hypothetical protein
MEMTYESTVCGECLFCHPTRWTPLPGQQKQMECRRFPPATDFTRTQRACYPLFDPSHSICGEFKPREKSNGSQEGEPITCREGDLPQHKAGR